MTSAHAFAAVALIAFVLGLRGSVRLSQRYRAVSPLLLEHEREILLAFVIVAWLVTVAAGFFGLIAARRLIGYAPLEWTPLVQVLLASAVLLIPVFLDHIVSRVARVPWNGDAK